MYLREKEFLRKTVNLRRTEWKRIGKLSRTWWIWAACNYYRYRSIEVNAPQFNFCVVRIALSHGADADTLDRSAIRFAFQEDIEFPGFRRSNQFVAIRACRWFEFALGELLREQSTVTAVAALRHAHRRRRRASALFAQPSDLESRPEDTSDACRANLVRSTSLNLRPFRYLLTHPGYTSVTR